MLGALGNIELSQIWKKKVTEFLTISQVFTKYQNRAKLSQTISHCHLMLITSKVGNILIFVMWL